VHHYPDAEVEQDLARGLRLVGCVRLPHIDGVSCSINAEAGALEVLTQLREEGGVARSDVQEPQWGKPHAMGFGNRRLQSNH
jgi:hypothetical protein